MEINTSDMEEKAAARVKSIVKLNRELKGKDWDMIEFYKRKMTKFKDTMPLIQDLKVSCANVLGTIGSTHAHVYLHVHSHAQAGRHAHAHV